MAPFFEPLRQVGLGRLRPVNRAVHLVQFVEKPVFEDRAGAVALGTESIPQVSKGGRKHVCSSCIVHGGIRSLVRSCISTEPMEVGWHAHHSTHSMRCLNLCQHVLNNFPIKQIRGVPSENHATAGAGTSCSLPLHPIVLADIHDCQFREGQPRIGMSPFASLSGLVHRLGRIHRADGIGANNNRVLLLGYN